MLRGPAALAELHRLANNAEDQQFTDDIAEAAKAGILTCHGGDGAACTAGWWHPGLCPDEPGADSARR